MCAERSKRKKESTKILNEIPTAEQLLNGFWMQYLAIRELAGDAICAKALQGMIEDFNETVYSDLKEVKH